MSTADLPPDWSSKTDPKTNKTYYYNARTRETSWTRPQGGPSTTSTPAAAAALPAEWVASVDQKSGRTYYFNTKTKETSWKKPEAQQPTAVAVAASPSEAATPAPTAAPAAADVSEWVEKNDPRTGKAYYYNPKTRETKWTKPEGAAKSAQQTPHETWAKEKPKLGPTAPAKSPAPSDGKGVQAPRPGVPIVPSSVLQGISYELEEPPVEAQAPPLRPEQAEMFTQISDPTAVRRAMGFASPEDLRRRVAATMVSSVYEGPSARMVAKPVSEIGMQTEHWPPKETGVGPGVPSLGPPERTIELDIRLPTAQDFPILTIVQLLQAEQRTMSLLSLLEAELLRAQGEEDRVRLQAREQAMLEETECRRGLQPTTKWMDSMRASVERRLRVRHEDAAGTKLPTFWHRQKLDVIASPVRTGRRSSSPQSSARRGSLQ